MLITANSVVTCQIFWWHCLFLLNMPQRFRKCLLWVRTVTTLPHVLKVAVDWARLVIFAVGFGRRQELEWVNPRHTAVLKASLMPLWEWLGSVWEFALGYGGDLVGLQKQATECLSEITSRWWNGLYNLLRAFLGLWFDLQVGCVNPLLWSLFLSLCRK